MSTQPPPFWSEPRAVLRERERADCLAERVSKLEEENRKLKLDLLLEEQESKNLREQAHRPGALPAEFNQEW